MRGGEGRRRERRKGGKTREVAPSVINSCARSGRYNLEITRERDVRYRTRNY